VPDALLWLTLLGVFDAAIDCDNCEQWNRPQEPFHIYGNTWYVGTGGLASILIETDDGLVVLDGGLPQSAELIATNIRILGFDPADIRFIGLSHAHYDHAGGIAALQRLSGATVYASHDAARSLRNGALQEDDPQFGGGMTGQTYPAVPDAVGVADGWEFHLADFAITALHTPGHTVGGMSWTWQACEEDRCLDVVYVDSLSAVSRPGYLYSDGLGDVLRETLGRLANLDCDIMLSTHDFSFGLHRKLQQGAQAFIGDQECRDRAATTLKQLQKRLESEQA
jgi:metallo-beta-lactamase class B